MIGAKNVTREYMELHDVNPSMVRLFVGMEDVEDIKEDLDRALKRCI